MNEMMPPPGMEMGPPPMEQGGPPPMEEGAPPKERNVLSPAEELDSDIAFGLMSSLVYSEQGSKVLGNALKTAENPAPAIALFIATAVEKINKQMEGRGMAISPNAWLAEGAAVDRIMDEVAELGGMMGAEVSPQLESMVMAEVIDQLKLMGQAEKQGAQQGPPPQGMAPNDPSQGMPPGDPMMAPPPMGGMQ